jgi:hypothetical protein
MAQVHALRTATIGVDFKVKVIERKGKRWKLSIWVSVVAWYKNQPWRIAGQEAPRDE